MRGTPRFILNFVIGFLVLVVCSLSFLLVSHAPMPLGGSIAKVQIGEGSSAVHNVIPGYEFSCTRGSQLDRCEVMLASRPLEIVIAYADPKSKRNVIRCQVFYAGLTTNCTTDFESIIMGGWLPVVDIRSNLGLSNLQLQKLQMQAVNKNIVLQLGEDNLVLFVIGIAIAIGLVAAASGWLYFGKFTKVVAGICLGFVMFRVSWRWLGGIPFNLMLKYGMDTETWIQWQDWIAIVAGITTSIATTRLLWSQRSQLAKMFVCISSGYGAFTISWVFFLYSLLALGYAD